MDGSSPLLDQLQAELLAKSGLPAAAAGQLIALGLGAGNVHVDAPVSNLLVKYENRDFIADRVMPVVRVNKRSNLYRKLKPETMFNLPDALIASQEAMPNRANYGLDTNGTYSVKDYGLLDFVSTDEEANADAPLEPRMIAEDAVMGFLMLAREYRVAQQVFSASNYGSNTEALSGTDRWDNAASDPVAKILARMRAPLVRPNTMVIGEEAWDSLRTNAAVIKYVISRAQAGGVSTPLMVDEDTIARAFRLKQVLVGTSIYNSAREGATASFGRIWGKSCALIRVEENPNPRNTQTFGYTFRFTAGQPEFAVQQIYQPLPGVRGGTFIKLTHSDDENIVGGSYTGYLMTTVIS